MLPLLRWLLLGSGLLLGAAWHPVAARPGQQPERRAFPHFRPAEKRKPRHYKPKTWREKAPAPRPRAAEAPPPAP